MTGNPKLSEKLLWTASRAFTTDFIQALTLDLQEKGVVLQQLQLSSSN
jgi:hypothetical protein